MGLPGIYFLFSVGLNQAQDFLVAADLLAALSSTPALVIHIHSAAFRSSSRYAAVASWEDIRAESDTSHVFDAINRIHGTAYANVSWVGQGMGKRVVNLGLNLSSGAKDISVNLYSPDFANDLLEHVSSADVVEISDASVGFQHVVLDAIYQCEKKPKVTLPKRPSPQQVRVEQVDLESIPYVQLLQQVFKERLIIANQLASPTISQVSFGYGAILAHIQTRQTFLERLRRFQPPSELRTPLTQYLLHPNDDQYAKDLEHLLKEHHIEEFKDELKLLYRPSYWVLGGDVWWGDIGDSGFHQVLQSGEDINLLILDTHTTAKKDLGLYAMSYQSAYVASCAIYASYAHATKSLLEAHRFPGTSVVLAYLPVSSSDSLTSVRLIKDSKVAVDTGKWPLYRWDPHLETVNLTLDSAVIKEELDKFLKREEQVYELSSKFPVLAPASFDAHLQKSIGIRKSTARDAVAKLLSGLNKNVPMTILYGSDGGNADRVAKLLEKSAQARNFPVKRLAANDITQEEFLASKLTILVVSTAGQGEFPMNARNFWKRLAEFPSLDGIQFGVFGLGDSHYWPNAGDEAYFNQPARDLQAKLIQKGAHALTDVGLGDDQAPEGYMSAYREWEPALWQALGNDQEVAIIEEPKVSDDQMKVASNFLRGTILENLDDRSTGCLPEADTKLTKFHGIYQQDDRDLREERIERGLEPKYSFMVRVRVPGGVASPHQWLAMDGISDQLANCTIKLTTRQAFQFHGVLKWNLRPTLQAINKVAMDTLAACGDVNRNVMVSCHGSPIVHAQVNGFARDLSRHLSPQTSAYAEIWLDKVLVGGPVVVDHEPLYGPTYLPRKFKIAIAIPPNNDVDVHAHCLGFVAILDGDSVTGYTVTVGGWHGGNS
ncbi:Sulfite reductase [NADPH] subunit beta [Entomophthora muscae]|uniref:Sulfite reductase [NADPH] subunit beta n=1 Tax=Entomophthora muscae TaxID=34485 RepID=A0ACC2S346_9FUNG|nr:Sulfite reductase [NADPH] subunit beta [Entomophthora muscae]